MLECSNPVKAKGLCGTHYTRFFRTGSTDRKPLNRELTCSEAPCPNLVQSKGLCAHHYEHERHVTQRVKRNAQARTRYIKDSTKKRASVDRWAKANPVKVKLNNQVKRARKRNAPGKCSEGDWIGLCNRFGGKCAYCRKKAKLTMDHVIPLSRGGTHWIGNILPACKSCNSSKNGRLLIEWKGIR